LKRSFVLLMAIVLAVSAAFANARPIPTRAAAPTLSDLFPEKTFVYGELDTTNLSATLDSFYMLANQFGANIPIDWRKTINDQLNQALKPTTPLDFDKDIIGWIGDRIAVGVLVPDAAFNIATNRQPANAAAQPQTATVVTVKDEAKADAFVNDVLLKAVPSIPTPTTETINGETVTVYAVQPDVILARWKGYIVVGQSRLVLDTLKDKKPTLTGDANYKKLLATLKPGTVGSVYIRTPLAANSVTLNFLTFGLLAPSVSRVFSDISMQLQGTPTPTPSPTPSPSPDEQRLVDTFLALGGSMYSVRSDGKALLLDVTSAYEPDAVKRMGDILGVDIASVIATPKTVEGKLLDVIPADASAVILGSDIPQIYNSTVVQIVALQKAVDILTRRPNASATSQQTTAQIEGGVKLITGLDLQKDILAWTGDYAIYLSDDKGGTLDKATQGAFPYAQNIVIASSDPAKSAALAEALVRLINTRQSPAGTVTPATADASGLVTIAVDPTLSAKLGTVDGNFVFSTGAEFTLQPTSGISSSTAWQNAVKFAPKGYSQLFYVDADKLTTLADSLLLLSPTSASTKTQIEQFKTALKPFESALIVYTPGEAGVGTTSFVLIQK
jgi:hypothetical protein